MDGKFGPFDLATLVDSWSEDGSLKIAGGDVKNEDSNSIISLLTDVSEDVSFQLHSGIMKSARRLLLDEVISSIIPEFFASKKAQRHLRRQETSKDTKISSDNEVTFLLDVTGLCIMIFDQVSYTI